MAPIKFEESIKEKLEKRTLVPSEDAWTKLSSKLDQQKNNKKSPLFWWLGIAASLMVLVMISVVYFGTEQQESVIPAVVETVDDVNTNNKPLKNNQPPLKQTITQDKIVQNESAVNLASTTTKSKIKTEEINNTAPLLQTQKEKKAAIINTPQISELTDIAVIDSQAISNILKEVSSSNDKDIESEIDSLLELANIELLNDKIFKKSTMTVDASALLQSVEEELDQSFRSKMLEVLISGYETVKTAVVNRNQ